MINASTTKQTPHDLQQGGSANAQFGKLVNAADAAHPIVELRQGEDGLLRLYTKDLTAMSPEELAKYKTVTGQAGSVLIEVVSNG